MLTAKQEQFVQNIIKGMNQAEAYRAAYSTKNMSGNAVWCEASKLADNPKVAQRLRDLREQLAGDAIMTAKERLQWLTCVVRGKEKTADKLKAVDIMNRMQGEYVTKVEGRVQMEKLEDTL